MGSCSNSCVFIETGFFLYELSARVTNAVNEISEQQINVFSDLEYPCERCTLMMTVMEVTLKVRNLKSIPLKL